MTTAATLLPSWQAQMKSEFQTVSDHIFWICGLWDSKLIYLGCVSVFFLRSRYFAWDWHKWRLNYVEITGVIALLSIHECPAGCWLNTHSNEIYMLLKNVVQYKYSTKSNILSITILTNLHLIVAMVRPKALAVLPWTWTWLLFGLGFDSNSDFFSYNGFTTKAVPHNNSAWNLTRP